MNYFGCAPIITIRTAKLNFPDQIPAPPDPDMIQKLDVMIGRGLGTVVPEVSKGGMVLTDGSRMQYTDMKTRFYVSA